MAEENDRPRQYGRELYAVAEEVRDTLLKQWDGTSEDDDSLVELTPDGAAICDGAFEPMDLYRVAEAAIEAQRRCAPALGFEPMPPLDQSPQALDALDRLLFTIGPRPGSPAEVLISQAVNAVANHERIAIALDGTVREKSAQIERLNQKLAQVRAVLEAEKRARAVGATVVDAAVVDQLYAALTD